MEKDREEGSKSCDGRKSEDDPIVFSATLAQLERCGEALADRFNVLPASATAALNDAMFQFLTVYEFR